MNLTIVFLACRYDRPTALFLAALTSLAKGKPDVIVLTEVAAMRHRLALRRWANDNGYALHQGAPGPAGECAVLVQVKHGSMVSKARPITSLTVGDRGRVWTLDVWVLGLLIIAGHLPRSRYVRASRQAGRVLRHYIDPRESGEQVAVVMDFNRDQKTALGYRWLHRHMPGLRSAWRKPYPRRGTHSGRLIDGLWTNAEILKPSRPLGMLAGSDHEAFTTTLRVKR